MRSKVNLQQALSDSLNSGEFRVDQYSTHFNRNQEEFPHLPALQFNLGERCKGGQGLRLIHEIPRAANGRPGIFVCEGKSAGRNSSGTGAAKLLISATARNGDVAVSATLVFP